jgi:hypothetical protein
MGHTSFWNKVRSPASLKLSMETRTGPVRSKYSGTGTWLGSNTQRRFGYGPLPFLNVWLADPTRDSVVVTRQQTDRDTVEAPKTTCHLVRSLGWIFARLFFWKKTKTKFYTIFFSETKGEHSFASRFKSKLLKSVFAWLKSNIIYFNFQKSHGRAFSL